MLPERGAELHALRHRPSGIDVLFHAPWGLAPPGAPPRDGSDGHGFLERYAGGWQELFPSANDPTTYDGADVPFHGEVALLEWDVRPEGEELVCRVSCVATPFDLERRMRLEGDALVLDETVTNRGDRAAHFVWGHHCVLGPPFLEARLPPRGGRGHDRDDPGDVGGHGAAGARTADRVAARRAARRRHGRPARGARAGGGEPRRRLPDRPRRRGAPRSTNPRLGLTFALEFDPAVFRWLITWQPYGGAHALPLAGAYALGVEPWVAQAALGEAAAAGDAILLAGGGTFSTRLRARVQEGDAWPE